MTAYGHTVDVQFDQQCLALRFLYSQTMDEPIKNTRCSHIRVTKKKKRKKMEREKKKNNKLWSNANHVHVFMIDLPE